MQGQADNLLQHGNIGRAVRVLDRMENQNTFKELIMDFKASFKASTLVGGHACLRCMPHIGGLKDNMHEAEHHMQYHAFLVVLSNCRALASC